jgi:hypothetical protein
LLVAVQPNYHGPILDRCNLDGTGCAYVDISAASDGGALGVAGETVDTTTGKLLMTASTTVDASGSGKPHASLLRCDLDGTNCIYRDISAGQANWTTGSAAIDTTNGKILVPAIGDIGGTRPPAVLRCNLDGTGCAYQDVSAGRDSGLREFSAFIDETNHRLLAVSGEEIYPSSFTLGLRVCNLDGTNCNYVDISAGQSAVIYSSAVIDAVNRKLLVVGINGVKLGLFVVGLP